MLGFGYMQVDHGLNEKVVLGIREVGFDLG